MNVLFGVGFTSSFICGILVIFQFHLKNGFRESLIKTFIAFSFFVLISNEILSLFNGLSALNIQLLYTFSTLFTWFYIGVKGFAVEGLLNVKKSLGSIWSYYSGVSLFLLWGILASLLFLAIYVAPNNMDVMGYHIPRVALWAQNQNLNYFPTEFLAQLFYNVQLEYFLLHSYLLFESDLFFNVVEWCALIIVLITTSKLLKWWSFDPKIQGLGVFVTLTMPLSILTATSSKNDLLSACYLLVAIYFGFKVIGNQFSWADIFYGLSAFIFAGFTKYSAWLIGFPLAAGFGIYLLLNNFFRSIKILGVFSGLFVLIFGPFFYRNYAAFGQIVRPEPSHQIAVPSYSNEILSWKTVVSNLAKMAGNHVGLPLNDWNQYVDKLVFAIHDLIRFPANELLTAWSSYITNFTINEDFSGNFAHFFLIIFAVLVCLTHKNLRKSIQFNYFLLLFFGLATYALLIKWNAFNARTQLPYFIALSPFVTFSLAKFNVKFLRILCFLLIIQILPFLLLNSTKKVLPFYYLYKKEVSHLPKSIFYEESKKACYDTLTQLKIYRKEEDVKGRPIYMLNEALPESKKRVGFSILDKYGFYKMDKTTIFSNPLRASHYIGFFPNDENYYLLVFKALGSHYNKVGIVSNSSNTAPFYTLGKELKGEKFEMKYIRFSPFFNNLMNPQSYFYYDAILSDDKDFVNSLQLAHARKIKIMDWYVILLEKPSNKIYYLNQ